MVARQDTADAHTGAAEAGAAEQRTSSQHDPQHVGAVLCALMQGFLDTNLASSSQVLLRNWVCDPSVTSSSAPDGARAPFCWALLS